MTPRWNPHSCHHFRKEGALFACFELFTIGCEKVSTFVFFPMSNEPYNLVSMKVPCQIKLGFSQKVILASFIQAEVVTQAFS